MQRFIVHRRKRDLNSSGLKEGVRSVVAVERSSVSQRSSQRFDFNGLLGGLDSHDRSSQRSGQSGLQNLSGVSNNNRSRSVVDLGLDRSDQRSVIGDGSSHCVRSYSVNQRSDWVGDGDGLVRLSVLVGIDALVRQVLQQIRSVDIGRSGQSNGQNSRQDDLKQTIS